MAFKVDVPYRTDLPASLRVTFFATEETAKLLAKTYGGEAWLEGTTSGGPEPAWFVAFPGKRVPWNAGDLYTYLQNHPDYNPSA